MTSASARRIRRDSLDEQERLTAGLWQQTPFPRLPIDAPDELGEYLQDIENPYRVYRIHCASRRHGFQQLVDRYVTQLRNGCGVTGCPTASCFTCRKRLAGKAPIRRYNPTSARTLAVYLASRENPEQGLCPNLRPSRDPPIAVNNLTYALEKTSTLGNSPAQSTRRQSTGKRQAAPPAQSSSGNQPRPASSSQGRPASHKSSKDPETGAQDSKVAPKTSVKISERPMSMDHRSFAASTFGTVAFKMLEWLTRRGIEEMAGRVGDLGLPTSSTLPDEETNGHVPENTPQPTAGIGSQQADPQTSLPAVDPAVEPEVGVTDVVASATDELVSSPNPEQAQTTPPPLNEVVPKPKRNSKTTFRPASSKSAKRSSLEAPSPLEPRPAPRSPTSRSQRSIGFHNDKLPRPPKTPGAHMTRGLPDPPSRPSFFENVPAPPHNATRKAERHPPSLEEHDAKDVSSNPPEPEVPSSRNKAESDTSPPQPAPLQVSLEDYPMPQSLSRLSVELVDFISDVFQQDKTSEATLFGSTEALLSPPEPKNRQVRLTRKRSATGNTSLIRQWKAFNEQAIFSVLSNPKALISSFTKDGKLFDSQSLWYCMLQLNRVAPTLVLHSLWLAAESLFAPPEWVEVSRQASRKPEAWLSAQDAGSLMSIGLHALMAAGSLATDSRTLYEVSRIRANGLALAESGTPARQPPSICLEYDDVFTNDVALRLARRLFRAIIARRCFAKMAKLSPRAGDEAQGLDILRPILAQLDLLSPDSARVLEFTDEERLLHETRAPTLLLDWAKAVLLADWDGQAAFSTNSPFGGAFSLIAAMYEERNVLLLGDTQFRIDYFSDRLESVEMPVAWLSFETNKQRQHILDHPYIFSPETLVSLFRSINFSQMSRMFEESSSLKTRMSAIVDPGSLITNPHHKVILQDMLKTASSKYLVLAISRENVLRDAFDQLWRRERRELLRPLKVHLGEGGGEEGFDSGGVQQEFFRMAIAECLDPKYGAFTVDERTRMAWFVPGSVVETWKFELMGLLVSLAVYNGLTLPVTFPKALYRKLLGQPVCELHHIADGWPELAAGLSTLVEWDERDGQIEDIFARTFEFSVSAFGKNISSRMGEGDDDKWPQNALDSEAQLPPGEDEDEAPLVTVENRDEYVSEYVRYLTDVSVRRQFLAFEKGFRHCLEPRSLSLLSPSILQSLVEGIQEIDISDLRRYARYVGWDASHHTVRDFWSIVRRYDDDMKRKLLEFVTASDRVPVGGMRNLNFVIQKNGEEDEGGHLPTAYTCYGTLLLPEYRDKDVLRERLGMALENAQGFGFA